MTRIKTYQRIKDNEDNLISGLKILTVPFWAINSDGSFETYTASTGVYADTPSVVLIIDDNTLNQIEITKLLIVNGEYQLHVKDGENFTYLEETEQEKQIRELKEQLAALEAAHQGE